MAYDDGDSEVLLLSKEIWRELCSNITTSSSIKSHIDPKDNKMRAAVNLYSKLDQINKNVTDMVQLTNTLKEKNLEETLPKT